MPSINAETILPKPAEDAAITAAAMSDTDAVPFTDAEWAQVKPLVHWGHCCLTVLPHCARTEKRASLPSGWGSQSGGVID